MKQILSVIISIFVLSGCCSTNNKEFEFDNNEPQHLGSYEKGDTIYFENSVNDIDTITVLSVDSLNGEECFGFIAPKPTGKSRQVIIKFLPIDEWYGVITNARTNDTTSINYTTLILMEKDPIENETFFTFQFKDFYAYDTWETVLGNLNTDTLKLNKTKVTNYYVINHRFPERVKDSTSIETLIWTDKNGLTAYKNKKGEWWVKKQKMPTSNSTNSSFHLIQSQKYIF